MGGWGKGPLIGQGLGLPSSCKGSRSMVPVGPLPTWNNLAAGISLRFVLRLVYLSGSCRSWVLVNGVLGLMHCEDLV